jgi:hypothetical protein
MTRFKQGRFLAGLHKIGPRYGGRRGGGLADLAGDCPGQNSRVINHYHPSRLTRPQNGFCSSNTCKSLDRHNFDSVNSCYIFVIKLSFSDSSYPYGDPVTSMIQVPSISLPPPFYLLPPSFYLFTPFFCMPPSASFYLVPIPTTVYSTFNPLHDPPTPFYLLPPPFFFLSPSSFHLPSTYFHLPSSCLSRPSTFLLPLSIALPPSTSFLFPFHFLPLLQKYLQTPFHLTSTSLLSTSIFLLLLPSSTFLFHPSASFTLFQLPTSNPRPCTTSPYLLSSSFLLTPSTSIPLHFHFLPLL